MSTTLKDVTDFVSRVETGYSNEQLYFAFPSHSKRRIREVANEIREGSNPRNATDVRRGISSEKDVDIHDSLKRFFDNKDEEPTADSLTPVHAAVKAAGVERVNAPALTDFHTNGKYEFDRMKEDARRAHDIRVENPPDLVEYRIPTDKPVLITHFADLHFGNEGVDYTSAEKDARLVASCPNAFAFFGGDGIDNFVKHIAAIISAGSTPKQQVAALGYWLTLCPFLGGVGGNHEHWSTAIAGIEPLRQLFRERGIVYSPYRLRVILHVGSITYRIELRHNYRFKSSINLGNQFHRMWEMSDWEHDIGMLGHTHDGPYVEPFIRHSKERWGSLSGSYKVVDSHSEQWGFNHAVPHSPCFILSPDKYEIIGLNSLQRGVQVLNGIA